MKKLRLWKRVSFTTHTINLPFKPLKIIKINIFHLPEPETFKFQKLPLARVKKIMKADEDVKMISAEAPVLFAKACEMFIIELTHRSYYHTLENKRKTLQRSDISQTIASTDIYDFLQDIIPKEELREAQANVQKSQEEQAQPQIIGAEGIQMPTQPQADILATGPPIAVDEKLNTAMAIGGQPNTSLGDLLKANINPANMLDHDTENLTKKESKEEPK